MYMYMYFAANIYLGQGIYRANLACTPRSVQNMDYLVTLSLPVVVTLADMSKMWKNITKQSSV